MVTCMATAARTDGGPAGRMVFGHPIGLTNLFGVELWERFSFYGMLTILAYYLYYTMTDGGLGLPKATATGFRSIRSISFISFSSPLFEAPGRTGSPCDGG